MSYSPNHLDLRKPIVCVGEALIDLFAPPSASPMSIDSLAPRIGGAPANMSVAITRLGGTASFLGCLASDLPGDWIERRLRDEGVDRSLLRIVDGAQTRLALVTGPSDDRDFVFYGHPPADTLLTPDDVDAAGLGDAAAVIVTSLGLTREPSRSALYRVLEICRDHRAPVVFDPNPRRKTWENPDETLRVMQPVIEQAAVLKLGASEPAVLGLDVDEIREIQPPGAVLVLTDGARGCHCWYRDGGQETVPAFTVNAVDSTGAGDAFTAALTLRFVASDYRLSFADVEFASAVGALTTTGEGAMDALPRGDAVEALLESSRSTG